MEKLAQKVIWILGAVAAILILNSSSCDPIEIVTPDDGRDYFPLEQGKRLVYQVDSIIFDDAGGGNVLDTFSSQIREVISDPLVDLTGDTIYQIERSFRRSAGDNWQVTDIYSISASGQEAIRTEENVRLVKMRFPLRDGITWEPTKFISPHVEVPVGTEFIQMFSFWEGIALAVDRPEVVGGFSFAEVLTCQQADDDLGLERRFVMEKYAKGVGLVLRVDTIVDSRCARLGRPELCLDINNSVNPPDTTAQPWIVKGEKGYIMRQEIIDFN